MGWIVQHTGKDGKPATSAVFGSDTVAASYARTVKDGKVVPSGVNAPPVDVQKVPDGATVDADRLIILDALAREHARDLEAQAREQAAESYAETGAQARLYGASSSDALDDARDVADRVYRHVMAQPVADALDPRVRGLDGIACAGGCGRTVKNGFTTCRTCAKGL